MLRDVLSGHMACRRCADDSGVRVLVISCGICAGDNRNY